MVQDVLPHEVGEIVLGSELPLVGFVSDLFPHEVCAHAFCVLKHVIEFVRKLQIFHELISFDRLICASPLDIIALIYLPLEIERLSSPFQMSILDHLIDIINFLFRILPYLLINCLAVD